MTALNTDEYRSAPSDSCSALGATWRDKPHRLVYDLCNEVDRLHAVIDGAISDMSRMEEVLDGEVVPCAGSGCLAGSKCLETLFSDPALHDTADRLAIERVARLAELSDEGRGITIVQRMRELADRIDDVGRRMAPRELRALASEVAELLGVSS